VLLRYTIIDCVLYCIALAENLSPLRFESATVKPSYSASQPDGRFPYQLMSLTNYRSVC